MDREKQKKSRSGSEKRKRTVQVNVRFTSEEAERLKRLGSVHNLGIAGYIRYIMFGQTNVVQEIGDEK